MIVTIMLFGVTPVAALGSVLIGLDPVVVSKTEEPAKSDPDKMVCRTNDAIGSRLKRERRCFKLSEWEELRQLDRRAIDRIQANRYNGNS